MFTYLPRTFNNLITVADNVYRMDAISTLISMNNYPLPKILN